MQHRISLLSLEQPEPTPFPDTLETEVPAEELAHLEVALNELDAMEEAIEDAQQVSETLLRLHDVVDTVPADQALDPIALEMLKITYQDLCQRVGFSATSTALEAFEGSAEKADTKTSLMDTIQKILKAVMDAIQKAIEWVKNFFKTLFDRVGRLQRYASELKQHTLTLKDQAVEAIELPQAAYSKYLRAKNHLLDGEQMVKGFKEYARITEWLQHEFIGEAKFSKVSDLTQLLVKNLRVENEAIFNEVWTKLLHELPQFKRSENQRGLPAVDVVRGESTLPFGDQSMYSINMVTPNQVKLMTYQIYLEHSTHYKTIDRQEQHIALTPAQALELSTQIEKHLDAYKDVATLQKKFESLYGEIRKLSQQAYAEKNAKIMLYHRFNVLVQILVKLFVRFSSQFKSYDLSVCQAALQFTQASLKAVKTA